MSKKRLILCIVVLGIVTGILGTGAFFWCTTRAKEIPPESIIPKEITAEIFTMKNWKEKIEKPKDEEVWPHVKNALEITGQIWNECQELVNSRQVKIWYWNGRYSSSWKSQDKKQDISITFRSGNGEITECRKRMFANGRDKEEIKDKGYTLRFYDDSDGLEWSSRRDGNEIVGFYPGNKIREYMCKLKVQENAWYIVEWDENGKIVREQNKTYKIPKPQQDPNSKDTAEKSDRIR